MTMGQEYIINGLREHFGRKNVKIQILDYDERVAVCVNDLGFMDITDGTFDLPALIEKFSGNKQIKV